MIPTSVLALFCDDIRDEKSGAVTLVGVFGDNVNLPPLPEGADKLVGMMIPRLCAYIRINFDVTAELGPISIKVKMPDGQTIETGVIDEAKVEEARATSKQGNPTGGLISRVQFGGLVMKTLGRLSVEVTIGSETYLAGFVNFISEEPAAKS